MKSGLSGRDKHLRMLLRMLPKRTDRRGFTLIELLVAILISGLIVSGLLYLVVEVLGINQRDSSRSDTQRDMQMAMDYITRDLREAFYVYGTQVEGEPGSETIQSCLANRADAAARGAKGQCTGLLAYLPDHLVPADKSNIPVLAFWKPEPLPAAVAKYCIDNKGDIGIVKVDASGNTVPNPIDKIPCVSQRMFTLVVYSLSTDNPNNTWKGRARIKRYALPHFSEAFTGDTKKPGWVAPIDTDNKRPLAWPFGLNSTGALVSLQVPVVENISTENVVLTDFVDIQPGAPLVLAPTPTPNSGYCPYNFEVANFGNFRPEFYACVRRAGINENPEVRVVIRGNAAGRGGLPLASSEVPFQLESNVMGRGAYGKQRSGS